MFVNCLGGTCLHCVLADLDTGHADWPHQLATTKSGLAISLQVLEWVCQCRLLEQLAGRVSMQQQRHEAVPGHWHTRQLLRFLSCGQFRQHLELQVQTW